MVSRALYTCMPLSVDPSSLLVFLHSDMANITFSDMSYQVTEGRGYVSITLLVVGEVLVEYTVVVDITGGTATGEYHGVHNRAMGMYEHVSKKLLV